jgi:hypothetical protein
MNSLSALVRVGAKSSRFFFARGFHASAPGLKACDPLRILFCGSDEFSIASLRALNAKKLESSSNGIASIDVVARPGKRTGRGLKTVSHRRCTVCLVHLKKLMYV